MNACEEIRPELIAFTRGELTGLAQARLEAHLDHCTECQRVESLLAGGLSQAQRYEPEVTEEELARLARRITPELAAARSRGAWIRPVLALAALVLALVSGWWLWRGSAAPTAPVLVQKAPVEAPPSLGPTAPTAPAAPELAALPTSPPAPLPSRALRRLTLPGSVRLVASTDFDAHGRDRAGDRLEFSHGFAVIDVASGSALSLSSPELELRASGARFWVRRLSEGALEVGVVRGRVELISGSRAEVLSAGQRRGSGPAPEAALLEDPFLAALETSSAPTSSAPTSSAPTSSAPTSSAPTSSGPTSSALRPLKVPTLRSSAAPVRASADVLRALADAESLADAGKPAEAIAVYDRTLADRRVPRAQRSLLEYERARVLGLYLGKKDEARRALLRLERGGELAIEAGFTRCELDLGESPCAARACLLALGKRPAAASEANLLLSRWGLERTDCSDHKAGR